MKKAKTKARGKGKTAARKAAKRGVESTKKRLDVAEVRENINDLVTDSATEIATTVIEAAKAGQLASAKYLFEAVGLYPPTEEIKVKAQDHSPALALLKRLGLPTESAICDEGLNSGGPASPVKGTAREAESAGEPERGGVEEKDAKSARVGEDTVE